MREWKRPPGWRMALMAAMLWVGVGAWAGDPAGRPRKIYAHFMGCYPVASAATAWHAGTTIAMN